MFTIVPIERVKQSKYSFQLKSFIAIFLLVAGFLFSPTTIFAAYSTGDPVKDKLLDVAQAKLDAEYQVFLDGDTKKLKTTKDSLGGNAADRVDDVSKVQENIYKMSADRGLRYTDFTSKLTVEKSEINQDNAVITATEFATRTLVSNGSKKPVLTKEKKTHRFSFTFVDGQWVLNQDEDLDKLIPAEHEPGIELDQLQKLPEPFSETGKNKSDKANPDARNKLKKEQANLFLDFLIKPAYAYTGTYNPTSAINYVRSYAYNYNSAYRSYSNDCTNFMSQALNWSGWQHVGGWYDDYHYWWYSASVVPSWGGRAESRSWINAHKFNFFARSSGRAFAATSWADFLPGDMIQMDFPPLTGEIEHTQMVTKIENGNLFVSQHSPSYVDKNFIEVINSNPNAAYYGVLFNYQY